MKTFREFLYEATTSDHDKAHDLVKKHVTGGTEDAGDSHDRLHVGAVHSNKVSKLHADLKKAGFKQHSGTHHPHMGTDAGDGATYHRFSKGNTHVHVSSSKNTWGHDEGDEHDHHHVEVHTAGK